MLDRASDGTGSLCQTLIETLPDGPSESYLLPKLHSSLTRVRHDKALRSNALTSVAHQLRAPLCSLQSCRNLTILAILATLAILAHWQLPELRLTVGDRPWTRELLPDTRSACLTHWPSLVEITYYFPLEIQWKFRLPTFPCDFPLDFQWKVERTDGFPPPSCYSIKFPMESQPPWSEQPEFHRNFAVNFAVPVLEQISIKFPLQFQPRT